MLDWSCLAFRSIFVLCLDTATDSWAPGWRNLYAIWKSCRPLKINQPNSCNNIFNLCLLNFLCTKFWSPSLYLVMCIFFIFGCLFCSFGVLNYSSGYGIHGQLQTKSFHLGPFFSNKDWLPQNAFSLGEFHLPFPPSENTNFKFHVE